MYQPSEGDAGISNRDLQESKATTIGARLRAARERAGLSREDVAARLKLPPRLIGRLEGNDYATLDHGVYLRGYLTSYAKLVNVPAEVAENADGCAVEPADLVVTGTVSRSRYLFDRYSVSATYLILTALIVAPAVWLATHGGLEQNLARTAPLDVPNGAAATTTGNAQGRAGASGIDAVSVAPPPVDIKPAASEPIVASMAPFPASPLVDEAPVVPIEKAGSHVLTLKITQASWVEVIGSDGTKLEYGLLPAGTERSYRSDDPLSVRIGNTVGVDIESDGTPVDLGPFRHANVARLVLFGPNGPQAPVSDN
ncbi:MAG: RodZ domain-containing protein [Rhodanobacteraceae bacterium]